MQPGTIALRRVAWMTAAPPGADRVLDVETAMSRIVDNTARLLRPVEELLLLARFNQHRQLDRLHRASRHPATTGTGLAIVYTHGGTITVESHPDTGTRFHLTLPCPKAG